MRTLRTVAAASCALALAIPVVTPAAASPARCPQIRDPRGDTTSYAQDSTVSWDSRSLDVLSASLSSDRRNLVATIKVDRLMKLDPHSYLWTFYFKTVLQTKDIWIFLRAERLTGGDSFYAEHAYSTGHTEVGPVFQDTSHTDTLYIDGDIDVDRATITMRLPMTALAKWGLQRRVASNLFAYATIASGVSAGSVGHPEQRQPIEEGGAGDDAMSDARYRIGDRGCR